MRFDLLWLFLFAKSLGFAAVSLGQGLQAALDQQYYGEEPVFITPSSSQEPPAQDHKAGTIYQVLSDDPKFSRAVKAINFVEDVASLLDDSSAQLTFFAPPDKVLRRPNDPHKKHLACAACNLSHNQPHDDRTASYSALKASLAKDVMASGDINAANYISQFTNLADAIDMLDEYETLSTNTEDDKRCKEILKIILRAVLQYHIIPSESYDISDLNRNTTYPTKLVIPGASDDQPLRLRVSQSVIPPFTAINFFVKVLHTNIKADNGVIHSINHPLLPPPSVFQELYLVPRFFSTLTSALQRSELTKDIDLRYIRGEGLTGSSLVTIFAPTNRAFRALPERLQLFLFSPFGERVLKKLLQYHIGPDVVVHSNFVHYAHTHETPDLSDAKSDEQTDGSFPGNPGVLFELEEHKWPVLSWVLRFLPTGLTRRGHRKPHVEPIYSANLTLETLFTNHTLNTYISQHKINFPFPGPKKPSIIDTKVFVNHHPVIVTDVVSLNGVIHVIDRLLDPRKDKGGGHHHRHHHQKSTRIHKSDHSKHACRDKHPNCFDHHPSDRKHHKHHKHHHHHHHKTEEAFISEYDDVWSDWENWLIQWADEQD